MKVSQWVSFGCGLCIHIGFEKLRCICAQTLAYDDIAVLLFIWAAGLM